MENKEMKRSKEAGDRADEKSSRVEQLVREFEGCTLPLHAFKHREHLTVALFYLTRMPVAAAAHQFRLAIRRFIAHYDKTGYNETITMFWINVIARFLMNSEIDRSLPDLLDELLDDYADSGLIYNYYSKELLKSDEAKSAWVAPDVKEGMKDEG
jgi:hypothetical protein